MSRRSPPSLRDVRSPRTAPPPPLAKPTRNPAASELQLAIARTGIGLELTSPLAAGCVSVRELVASLPGLHFPLDVSGGVGRFRHRRGLIERLVLEVPRVKAEAWASPKLRGVVGMNAPKVQLLVRRSGATVGVVSAADASALAFEVEIEAVDGTIALAVHDARGVGLSAPPTVLAVRTLQALVGDSAVRQGARFVFEDVAARVGRQLFPDRGARAPDGRDLVWSAARGHEDAWLLMAQRGDRPMEPVASVIVARQGCLLAAAADDAAFGLDFEKARGLLVDALERAPRHRELSRRLAEFDHALGGRTGGRSEAALATLRDAGCSETLLAAQLRRDVGDHAGARAAFERVGEVEPVGPLAALAYEAASALAVDPYEALALLDRATARAPTLPGPRWARLALRLTVGRLDDARADAEHLEALTSGSRARFAVWLRAGRAFRNAGHEAASSTLFERALRYSPKDAEAVAGLGAALVSVGNVTRGAELLTQAIALAEANGVAVWEAHLELGRVLATALGDAPAAIATVRAVPASAPESILARALEGRWRAAVGDLAGASLAYARARDVAEARLFPPVGSNEPARGDAVQALVEAARFERDVRSDWLAAQRHLGAALRLAPGDGVVQSEYRHVGLRLAGTSETTAEHEALSLEETFVGRDLPGTEPKLAGEEESRPDEAVDHARVEELTRKLQADPTDDGVVDELATRLLRLGRTHDLFALLAARLDEAGPERRASLLPKQREVLLRLEAEARAAGREDEASLYRDARSFLD